MKLQPYLNKLEKSKEFKKFKQKQPEAYICAGFFILDFETKKNQHHLDYYLPNKKIMTFMLDDKIQQKESETVMKKTPEKLDINEKLDLDQIHGIIQDEMKNRTVTEPIKKIIAILQTQEGKDILNVTCLLGGLKLLKVHIDDSSKSIVRFEEASMMDFVKRV